MSRVREAKEPEALDFIAFYSMRKRDRERERQRETERERLGKENYD